jgi:hypothetical protein
MRVQSGPLRATSPEWIAVSTVVMRNLDPTEHPCLGCDQGCAGSAEAAATAQMSGTEGSGSGAATRPAPRADMIASTS